MGVIAPEGNVESKEGQHCDSESDCSCAEDLDVDELVAVDSDTVVVVTTCAGTATDATKVVDDEDEGIAGVEYTEDDCDEEYEDEDDDDE